MARSLVTVSRPNPAPLATLDEITELAKAYGRGAKSDNTHRAYKSDWKAFQAFAASYGLESFPASAQTVAQYVTNLARVGKSVSTIRRSLAAIAYFHAEANFDNPTIVKQVRDIVSGIARANGTAPKRKAALTFDLLKDALLATTDRGLAGVRDRAVFLVGFWAALRRSEIAALDVADLRFHDGEGYVLTIQRSKTDQVGETQEIPLQIVAEMPALDPVRAIDAWLTASGIVDGPLFPSFSMAGELQKNRLDGRDVARLIQRIATRAGIKGDIGGHSLRAGFVTQGAKEGLSLEEIATISRHKSPQVLMGYIRRARILQDSPQRKMMGRNGAV